MSAPLPGTIICQHCLVDTLTQPQQETVETLLAEGTIGWGVVDCHSLSAFAWLF